MEWLDFKHLKKGYIMLISRENIPIVFKAEDVKFQIKLGCTTQRTPTKDAFKKAISTDQGK